MPNISSFFPLINAVLNLMDDDRTDEKIVKGGTRQVGRGRPLKVPVLSLPLEYR